MFWPNVTFYDKQWEVIESVHENDETTVVAGNMLGKDFVSGFIVVWFFCTRTPCRIVTTSVKDDHLIVLWSEIKRFISTSVIPLDFKSGGFLLLQERKIKKIVNGEIDDYSYVLGRVSSNIEGLQGHHALHTLAIGDEASGLDDEVHKSMDSWAKKMLWIGNPWPCQTFFRKQHDEGDIKRPEPHKGFYRKNIHISALESPNVKYGLKQKELGLEPDNKIICDGVKSYYEYIKNRLLWDPEEQCVKLDGRFYTGPKLYMFPEDWLDRAVEIHKKRMKEGSLTKFKYNRALGIDTAEGGDDSVWTVGDDYGILYQETHSTPNTADIMRITKRIMQEWAIDAKSVCFDSGGGGREHADYLRDQGYKVRTVGFGDGVKDDSRFQRRLKTKDERSNTEERKYAYKNMRAQMYGELRSLLNPYLNEDGYGIPPECTDLIEQLKPIPIIWDQEGRMVLLPKDVPAGNPSYNGDTLKKLLGRSPDHADSAVVMNYALTHTPKKSTAGFG